MTYVGHVKLVVVHIAWLIYTVLRVVYEPVTTLGVVYCSQRSADYACLSDEASLPRSVSLDI